jgi:hypothetical protein
MPPKPALPALGLAPAGIPPGIHWQPDVNRDRQIRPPPAGGGPEHRVFQSHIYYFNNAKRENSNSLYIVPRPKHYTTGVATKG